MLDSAAKMYQMISILPHIIAGISLLFLIAALSAHALPAGHQEIGREADWQAYSYLAADGRKVCALSSQPVVISPKTDPPRQASFIITRAASISGRVARNELAMNIGQALAAKKNAVMRIAETEFLLLPGAQQSGFDAQWAWPLNIADEPKIIAFMKAGYDMEISAELENGGRIRDRYSLKGVTAGIALLVKNCP